MVNTARRKERGNISFPAACLFGVLLALACGALLLPAIGLILMRGSDPARLTGALSFALSLLLPLLGGYVGARRRGHGGALVGLSVSTAVVFLFLLVALTLTQGSLASAAIPLYGGMLFTGTIGGALATHRPKRRRR